MVVALNEWLPSGVSLVLTPVDGSRGSSGSSGAACVEEENHPLLGAAAPMLPPQEMTTSSEGRGGEVHSSEAAFRGQLLKFERINAHLSNERTWLAWVRTSLSLVSCAFTLLDESLKETRAAWSVTFFITGCLFVSCVDLTWLTGWFRYRQTKDVLALPKDAIPGKFIRFRMHFQAHYLGVLLTITLIIYIISGARNLMDQW